MISDSQLYTLAIFLGSLAMLLIVLYHWLEINSKDDPLHETTAEILGGGAGTNMGEATGKVKGMVGEGKKGGKGGGR